MQIISDHSFTRNNTVKHAGLHK